MFFVGVSERVISPEDSKFLSGYPSNTRYSTGIHDDLKAHCFYLHDGVTEAAIVTLDLCFASRRRIRSIRAAVNASAGIPAENILISCTHTHSAPCSVGDYRKIWDDREEMYPDYLDFIDAQIAEGMADAKKNRFPAGIAFAKGICGPRENVGGNRHDPNGEHDEEVSTVLFQEVSGRVRGVIVSYSLHPTFLHAENTLITCDYPEYIYEYCKGRYGEDTVVAFQNGTSGDQSSRFFRSGQNFDEAKRVGSAIAKAGVEAAEKAAVQYEPSIRLLHGSFDPVLKEYPPYEEAVKLRDEAKAELDRLNDEKAPYPVVRTQECTLIGANKTVNVARTIAEKGMEGILTLVPFEMMTMVIGDVCMIGLPCEIFVRYGKRMKELSPYPNTYVATVTNGASSGYLCTPEAYAEGGYEALCSFFAPGNGEAIVEAQRKLFAENR